MLRPPYGRSSDLFSPPFLLFVAFPLQWRVEQQDHRKITAAGTVAELRL